MALDPRKLQEWRASVEQMRIEISAPMESGELWALDLEETLSEVTGGLWDAECGLTRLARELSGS